MAQFDVYKNTNPNTQGEIPYFIDIQHSILNELNTRMVIPIYSNIKLLQKLNILCDINDQILIIVTNKVTTVPTDLLETKVTNLANHRDEIIASIDFLITGF